MTFQVKQYFICNHIRNSLLQKFNYFNDEKMDQKNELEVDSVFFSYGRTRILSDIYFKCQTGSTAHTLA